jgi:hypothetical protein
LSKKIWFPALVAFSMSVPAVAHAQAMGGGDDQKKDDDSSKPADPPAKPADKPADPPAKPDEKPAEAKKTLAFGTKPDTFKDAGRPPRRQPDEKPEKKATKAINVFLEGPDGGWIVRIMGGEKTVEKYRDDFMKYVKSVNTADKKEDANPNPRRAGRGGAMKGRWKVDSVESEQETIVSVIFAGDKASYEKEKARWVQGFEGSDGKALTVAAIKESPFEANGIKGHVAEISGNWAPPARQGGGNNGGGNKKNNGGGDNNNNKGGDSNPGSDKKSGDD